MQVTKNKPIISVTTSENTIISFVAKVYAWMTLGLAVTAFFAFILSLQFTYNPQIISVVSLLILPVFIIELLLVVLIGTRASKMSPLLAGGMFLFYSALNGIFFSFILASYSTEIVAITFFATTITFLIMSIYGYVTNQDLTKFRNIAIMSLIGIIIASIINIFIKSDFLYWIVTYIGLIVFVVLIAYDTKKLKAMATEAEINNINSTSYAVNGALSLYLDFINLFLIILRILGGRR